MYSIHVHICTNYDAFNKVWGRHLNNYYENNLGPLFSASNIEKLGVAWGQGYYKSVLGEISVYKLAQNKMLVFVPRLKHITLPHHPLDRRTRTLYVSRCVPSQEFLSYDLCLKFILIDSHVVIGLQTFAAVSPSLCRASQQMTVEMLHTEHKCLFGKGSSQRKKIIC